MGAMEREVQQAIHPGLLRMAARGLVGPLAPIMGKSKGFRHVPWARGAVDVSPLDPSAGPRSRRWCLISPRAADEVRVRGASVQAAAMPRKFHATGGWDVERMTKSSGRG